LLASGAVVGGLAQLTKRDALDPHQLDIYPGASWHGTGRP
jgi:hypothetical protein